MGRIRGLSVFIGGLVLMTLGLGMWRSTEVNWAAFKAVWSTLIGDITRLVREPFALMGIVVLVIGFVLVVNGGRRLIRG